MKRDIFLKNGRVCDGSCDRDARSRLLKKKIKVFSLIARSLSTCPSYNTDFYFQYIPMAPTKNAVAHQPSRASRIYALQKSMYQHGASLERAVALAARASDEDHTKLMTGIHEEMVSLTTISE
jgi:hypothetical protein